VLLMAVFRSLWVPLVSAAFNLLSIAAAYGVVVLVFQDAVGSRLLGVDGEVPIVSFVPLRASLSSSSTSRIFGPTSARPCWSSVPAASASLRCSLSADSSGYHVPLRDRLTTGPDIGRRRVVAVAPRRAATGPQHWHPRAHGRSPARRTRNRREAGPGFAASQQVRVDCCSGRDLRSGRHTTHPGSAAAPLRQAQATLQERRAGRSRAPREPRDRASTACAWSSMR
jgi:hypothetical protein